jgi:hypothetical protein
LCRCGNQPSAGEMSNEEAIANRSVNCLSVGYARVPVWQYVVWLAEPTGFCTPELCRFRKGLAMLRPLYQDRTSGSLGGH